MAEQKRVPPAGAGRAELAGRPAKIPINLLKGEEACLKKRASKKVAGSRGRTNFTPMTGVA
jgi:hypothetical protein